MLPSILDVAQEHGIEVGRVERNEHRCKCPFCKADENMRGKHYLSLNAEKGTFKCWHCEEAGGVLIFLALLRNTSVEEVKKSLWGDKTPRRVLHPAERLTPTQLKTLGFVGPGWYTLRKRDYALYKRTLEWVWNEWKKHVTTEKRDAYLCFLVATSSEARKKICHDVTNEVGGNPAELMATFVGIMFSQIKSEWAVEADIFASALTNKEAV